MGSALSKVNRKETALQAHDWTHSGARFEAWRQCGQGMVSARHKLAKAGVGGLAGRAGARLAKEIGN